MRDKIQKIRSQFRIERFRIQLILQTDVCISAVSYSLIGEMYLLCLSRRQWFVRQSENLYNLTGTLSPVCISRRSSVGSSSD